MAQNKDTTQKAAGRAAGKPVAAAAGRSKSAARKLAKSRAAPKAGGLEELLEATAVAKAPAPKKRATAAKAAAGKRPAQAGKKTPARKPAAKADAEPVKSDWCARLGALARRPQFQALYGAGGLAVLLGTTAFWSVRSAQLHQLNADQVVDAYLFESLATFRGANFPGAHTFLLKWPIFALQALFGFSPAIYMIVTVLMALATVGFLAYLLARIERRPAVFGTLCLALSSVLLLVPAQPYPGALLPVNMAMTTTRNLEYVLFLAAVLLACRMRRVTWRSAGLVIGLLVVLIASDKLFAVLAVGAGLFAVAFYALVRRRQLADSAGYWLLAAIGASLLATVLLLAANALGLTKVPSGQTASPFMPINSLRELTLGGIYGLTGLLTNFGANPAHGAVIARDIPGTFVSGLLSPAGIVYAVNLLLLAVGLYSASRLLLHTRRSEEQDHDHSWPRAIVLLVGASLTMLAVFVLTDHYYPVDARYMTITLFTLFLAAAVYLRSIRIRPLWLATAGVILVLVQPIAVLHSLYEYRQSEAALQPRAQMNAKVAEAVQRRSVGRVIGNYWDALPVKSAVRSKLTVAPTGRCMVPRQVLSSSVWFKPEHRTGTAYLAVKDGSPAAGPDFSSRGRSPTYGGCSLAHIVASYGTPSERIAIGSPSKTSETPDVLLLLYPNGTADSQARQREAARITPTARVDEPALLTPLSERAVCSLGTTMQVVAHQDDDLLFMNPDLQDEVRQGRCLRTVYLTAGDAGEPAIYWGSREKGAKAAYAAMYGVDDSWEDQTQLVADKKLVVSYLRDVPEVSLVFVRLPDGNLQGQGFAAREYDSLRALLGGRISLIKSVEGQQFSRTELSSVLTAIMQADMPDQVRTLGAPDLSDGDHADHHDAGRLTDEAAAAYAEPHSVTHYLGYPDRDMGVNLSDDQVTSKQTVFLAYAKFDGAVCQTVFECQNTLTYGHYLMRQYPLPLLSTAVNAAPETPAEPAVDPAVQPAE